MINLKNKNIIVTGASGGNGSAISDGLEDVGALVVRADLPEYDITDKKYQYNKVFHLFLPHINSCFTVHDCLSESEVVVESFFASFAVSFVVDVSPYVTVVLDGLTLRLSILTHPIINRVTSKMIIFMLQDSQLLIRFLAVFLHRISSVDPQMPAFSGSMSQHKRLDNPS